MFLPVPLSPSVLGFVRYFLLGVGPKTGLPRWAKKGGTGKNENFHGFINRLVHGVARLGADVCDARLLQLVIRHNLAMDRKHSRLSYQSTPWVWREREINDAAKLILDAVPFPKAGRRPEVSPSRRPWLFSNCFWRGLTCGGFFFLLALT